MKPYRTAAGLAAALIMGASLALVATAGQSSAPRSPKEQDLARGGESFDFTVGERGNTRWLFASPFVSDSASTLIGTASAATELDVTQMVLTLYGDAGSPNTGQVNAYIAHPSGVTSVSVNCLVSQRENVVMAFDPPVRFRTGDLLVLSGRNGPLGSGVILEVSMHGFIPSAVRTEGMTVQ